MGDAVTPHPGLKIAEWYRPHLGAFLNVDKDGLPCRAEPSGTHSTRLNNTGSSSVLGQSPGDERELDGFRSSVVPTDSLVHSHPAEGTFWSNLGEGNDYGQHASQSPWAMEGLVYPCSFVL